MQKIVSNLLSGEDCSGIKDFVTVRLQYQGILPLPVRAEQKELLMFQWAQAGGGEVLVKTEDGPVVTVDDLEDRLEQEEVSDSRYPDPVMESS